MSSTGEHPVEVQNLAHSSSFQPDELLFPLKRLAQNTSFRPELPTDNLPRKLLKLLILSGNLTNLLSNHSIQP